MMAPTLSLRISDLTLADIGNLAVLAPQCPIAFSPGDSLAAVNGYGSTWGRFARHRSNHDFKQRSPVRAAHPRRSTAGFAPRAALIKRPSRDTHTSAVAAREPLGGSVCTG
jgi:hypothetical protein